MIAKGKPIRIEWLIFDSVSYRLPVNIEIYIIDHHTLVSYYGLIFSLWVFVTHFSVPVTSQTGYKVQYCTASTTAGLA